MSGLGPVLTEQVIQAYGCADGTVLGHDIGELLKFTRRSVGVDIDPAVPDDALAVNILGDILDHIPDGAGGRFLAELIEVAGLFENKGSFSFADGQLAECEALRDKVVRKEAADGGGRPAPPAAAPVNENWPLANEFKFANKTFHDLMVNQKLYYVPPYQRPYCWTVDQHEDFWHDLEECKQQKTLHFMGFVVLRQNGELSQEVLDGQQRFATMLILILAAMIRLKELALAGDQPEENERYRQVLRRILVPERMDDVVYEIKFELCADDHLQLSLMILEEKPWHNGKNDNLTKALAYYRGQFGKMDDGRVVSEYVQAMLSGTYYSEVLVPNQQVAYKLFECLNNRGIPMAGADMIKNLLISTAQGKRAKVNLGLGERWDKVMAGMGRSDFPGYFKAIRMSHGDAGGDRDMYRKVRALVNNSVTALAFVRELQGRLPDYQALTDKNLVAFRNDTAGRAGAAASVRYLKLFNATSHVGLALAALMHCQPRQFVILMDLLLDMEIRYSFVCRLPRNRLERRYAKIAARISQGTTSIEEIRGMLAKRCPSDDTFRSAFQLMSMPEDGTSQQAAYLLRCLETQASNSSMRPAEAENLTIEHVLPQAVNEWWHDHFGVDDPEQFTNRLGNMALMPAKANKRLGQADVASKFAELRDTGLVTNKHLAEGEAWNQERLHSHQEYLADLAVKAWPMP